MRPAFVLLLIAIMAINTFANASESVCDASLREYLKRPEGAAVCSLCKDVVRLAYRFSNNQHTRIMWPTLFSEQACSLEQERRGDCVAFSKSLVAKKSSFFQSEASLIETAPTQDWNQVLDDRATTMCLALSCCEAVYPPAVKATPAVAAPAVAAKPVVAAPAVAAKPVAAPAVVTNPAAPAKAVVAPAQATIAKAKASLLEISVGNNNATKPAAPTPTPAPTPTAPVNVTKPAAAKPVVAKNATKPNVTRANATQVKKPVAKPVGNATLTKPLNITTPIKNTPRAKSLEAAKKAAAAAKVSAKPPTKNVTRKINRTDINAAQVRNSVDSAKAQLEKEKIRLNMRAEALEESRKKFNEERNQVEAIRQKLQLLYLQNSQAKKVVTSKATILKEQQTQQQKKQNMLRKLEHRLAMQEKAQIDLQRKLQTEQERIRKAEEALKEQSRKAKAAFRAAKEKEALAEKIRAEAEAAKKAAELVKSTFNEQIDKFKASRPPAK